MLFLLLVNFFRVLRNGWRSLWRRRVDYVVLELGGSLPEYAAKQPWWRQQLPGARTPLSLIELRRRLWQIGDDATARGILLKIDGLATGWATLGSLRAELLAFRARGKRVIAYLATPDNAGYFVACAADEILMPPSALFSVIGLYSEVQYLGDALARVGIQAEVEAVSPYKAAYERFNRNSMTPENRAQLERLIDQRYETLVVAVAEGRDMRPEQVRGLIDQAPFSASAAREHGLIDAALYEDELAAHLADGEQQPKITPWDEAPRALRLPMARRHAKYIGFLPVEGAIIRGSSQRLPLPLPLLGQQQAGSESLAQAIRQAERNKRMAALVLYVNSPGGDAYASDLIWREVVRLKKQKPVVVVMGDVAASGGYYLAAPASAIIAQPTTLTGSIGVISMRPVIGDLLAKGSIVTESIQRGENSGLMTISRPPSEHERAAWRAMIGDIYDQFKQRVISGRGISDEQLEPIAGGRVWSGSDALGHGLVDALGGLPAGLRRAQELAQLPPDERAPLVVVHGGRGNLAPSPFPHEGLAALLATVEQGLKPGIWAMLPWHGL